MMEDRSRNGDGGIFYDKMRVKDRYQKKCQHQQHYELGCGNDKGLMVRCGSGSGKVGRSHGDFFPCRRSVAWRSLVYMFGFCMCLFVARQFIDFFHPAAERLLIQAHHHQFLPLTNNAVEERVDKAESLMVQDSASLPEHVLLLLRTCDGCSMLQKDDYECVYEGETGNMYRAPVISVDVKEQDLQIVRCPHPLQPKSAEGWNMTINLKENEMLVPSKAQYSNNFRWSMLTYEAVAEENTVVLFVKGLNLRRGKISSTDNLLCIFSPDLDSIMYARDLRRLHKMMFKSKVLMAAQEVIRCQKPKGLNMQEAQGMKVTVWEFRRGLLPSVARLNVKPVEITNSMQMLKPLHKVCVCTMLWNQAAFLREWIMYHGYLGMDRWFLYDNNSDDNIQEVVDSLGSFNVSRHVWPWIKSQEAGFSHCALRARHECEWVAFMDVDEFLNPIDYIQNGTMSIDSAEEGPTVMERLIKNATSKDTAVSKTGEIRIDCHSFGPSGLKKPPEDGVLAGYTCRLNRTERHKSIIRSSALSESLLNVVHHFHLKRGYRYRSLPRRFAVFNHYKYQVWDTFKNKFFRRVATYVTDWQENENERSNDRAPGLGTEPIEPPDWSERFCEVSDTVLKNFTIETLTDPTTHLLPWQ